MNLPRFALASGIMTAALGLALTASPARAFDEGSIFDSLTHLIGLSDGGAAPSIDYRQRAPLVLPPRMELRQPVQPGAGRNANWPQDPDVLRREEAARKRLIPSIVPTDPRMSKQELMAGRVAAPGRAPTPQMFDPNCRSYNSDGSCLVMMPQGLRNGPSTKRDPIVVGDDPGREYLTQPPTGYRRVTASTGTGPAAAPQVHDETSPYSFWQNLNPFRSRDDFE